MPAGLVAKLDVGVPEQDAAPTKLPVPELLILVPLPVYALAVPTVIAEVDAPKLMPAPVANTEENVLASTVIIEPESLATMFNPPMVEEGDPLGTN